jgi:hypothetical protein
MVWPHACAQRSVLKRWERCQHSQPITRLAQSPATAGRAAAGASAAEPTSTTSGQAEIAVRYQPRVSTTTNGGEAIGALAGGWDGRTGCLKEEEMDCDPFFRVEGPSFRAVLRHGHSIAATRGYVRRGAVSFPPTSSVSSLLFAPLRGSKPDVPPRPIAGLQCVGLQWTLGDKFAP